MKKKDVRRGPRKKARLPLVAACLGVEEGDAGEC